VDVIWHNHIPAQGNPARFSCTRKRDEPIVDYRIRKQLSPAIGIEGNEK